MVVWSLFSQETRQLLWSYGVYLVRKPDNCYGRMEFIFSGNQTTALVVWSLFSQEPRQLLWLYEVYLVAKPDNCCGRMEFI